MLGTVTETISDKQYVSLCIIGPGRPVGRWRSESAAYAALASDATPRAKIENRVSARTVHSTSRPLIVVIPNLTLDNLRGCSPHLDAKVVRPL
jgi:hypothetical protein